MQIWAPNPLENHRRLVGNITMKKKSHWENRENNHETWEKIPPGKKQTFATSDASVGCRAFAGSSSFSSCPETGIIKICVSHLRPCHVSPTSRLRLRNLRSRRPRFKKNTAWLGLAKCFAITSQRFFAC